MASAISVSRVAAQAKRTTRGQRIGISTPNGHHPARGPEEVKTKRHRAQEQGRRRSRGQSATAVSSPVLAIATL